MKIKNQQFTVSDPSSGVSELIGGILMITIVVAAAAIIGVILFSQQTPEKIPNINFMAGSDNSNHLYLYHNGGDTLTKGTFSVLVDNDTRNDYTISDKGTEWSVGKNLVLDNVPSGAHNIAIIYNATGSGAVLLRSASSSNATLQNSISSSGAPVSGTTPTQDLVSCAAINFTDPSCYFFVAPDAVLNMFMKNVSQNSINYYRADKCSLSEGQIFSIKIMDATSKSSITINKIHPVVIKLSQNDIISIKFSSNSANFRTFGLAPQIWELTGDNVDLNITFANGTKYFSGNGYSTQDIAHTWISDYSNLNSDLAILCPSPGGQGANTALTVNSTQYINGQNDQNIEFRKIRPLSVGLFLIQSDKNSAPIYFVGVADGGIWIDGIRRQLGV